MLLAMHSHSSCCSAQIPGMQRPCKVEFLVPRHIFFFQTSEATISLFISFVTFIIRINVEVQYVTEHLLHRMGL